MPLYNYKCEQHGDFTTRRVVEERKTPAECPKCGELSEYTPTFETQPPIFRGSGFYETDYKKQDD